MMPAVDANRMTHAEKAAHIKEVVVKSGENLRARFPILYRQDAIGAAILAFAWSGMLASGAAYFYGYIPAWLCIPLVALFASLTHELEHDLIHWMYFRKTPWAHHLMMALVWLARPGTVSPWRRRDLHFNHHKVSGSSTDHEERAITNGERMTPLRLLMMADSVISVLVRLSRAKGWHMRLQGLRRAAIVFFPLGWLNWAIWYGFMGFHAANAIGSLAGTPISWSPTTLQWMRGVDFLTVVLVAPHVLRAFCLHFVSSNMHYYGDVEAGNVLEQTQVLKPLWMLPFQMFCCNFGATHAIHHFVVKEPFYIRQLTAATAHPVMREMGVRFNDTGTFRRANRYRALAA